MRKAQAPRPIYVTPAPNTPLTLFEGHLRLLQSGQVYDAPGSIAWEWLPRPGIRFKLSPLADIPELAEATLVVPGLDLSCDVSLTVVREDTAGNACEGLLIAPVSMPVRALARAGSEATLEQVTFHLPNFFIQAQVHQGGDAETQTDCLHLRSDAWDVVLGQVENAPALIGSLRDQGGFALTHTGWLKQADGEPFDSRQAEDALDALHYFLSCVRGLWCGPILAVGQTDGANVWHRWFQSNLSSWRAVETWFPRYDALDGLAELDQAFSGFMARWSDELWQNPIRHAIHWYVEANLGAGGIEGAIVLTQTALELLSWVYQVEDPATRAFHAADFTRLNAAERIQRFLEKLCMPIGIPIGLDRLHGAADEIEAIGGPETLVRLRNGIIHPSRSKRALLSRTPLQARLEAWHLGLWYLEMALLHLLGYDGSYYQRFLSGYPDQVRRQVPWAV